MKHVADFVHFDCEGFFSPKKLVVTQILPYEDEKDSSIVARVEVVVLADGSNYILSKSEMEKGIKEVNNLYEKIFFKTSNKDGFSVGDEVVPVYPSGKVYVSSTGSFSKIDVSLKCKGFTRSKDKKA